MCTNHMNTKNIICIFISNNFHKTIRISINKCFTNRHEREFPDFHVKSLFFRLFFRNSDT